MEFKKNIPIVKQQNTVLHDSTAEEEFLNLFMCLAVKAVNEWSDLKTPEEKDG